MTGVAPPEAPGYAVPEAPGQTSEGFLDAIAHLADGRHLAREEAALALERIVLGEAEEAQAAAFLMGLRLKGETAQELAGFLETMRRHVIPVEVSSAEDLLDIVGTGGDGLGTFNISTTAAFVAAGAGARVAKHGNRAASSCCGSADVLEALGVRVDLGPREVASCLERVGMAFMLATLHHPAMRKVAKVRRSLGIRTVFNVLGPLTNPAGAGRQLIGVSSPRYLPVVAGALAELGCRHALVVCSDEGMDEISVTGPTRAVEVREGQVMDEYVLRPEDLGLARADLAELVGGSPEQNAALTRAVLEGEPGARRNAVLLNAGAALYVAGKVASLREGLEAAQVSLDSGKALEVLKEMERVTNELAAGQL